MIPKSAHATSTRIRGALFMVAVMAILPVFARVENAGAHRGRGNATPNNDSAHPWKSNGCGPSFAGFLIPDSKRGVFNFNHACDHHDGCYAGFPRNGKPTYWATRKQCDEWFLGDMVASCKVTHGKNWGKTGAAKECNSKAYLYRQGVRERGKPFYKGPKSKNG